MTAPVATPDTEAQAPEAQDPVTNTAPAVQPTQPSQGAGPWASDLAELFPDENTRTQVDGFLRTKVQPHVTQLEQKSKDLELAGQLYSDLQDSPAETYLAITEEIFGPQAAEAIRDQLVSIYGEDEQNDEPDYEAQGQSQLPPEVEELLAERKAQKEREEYEQEMEAAVGRHPDIVPELFHPFVVAAQSDFELAYAGYARWLEQAKAQFGAQPEVQEPDPAPNVIGSDATGTTVPPTQKEYQSMDEALSDFFAEQRANKAPQVVGSV